MSSLPMAGHGDSPSFTPPHDLKACANDILCVRVVQRAPLLRSMLLTHLSAMTSGLASHLNVEPEAVFGHSFGGKVALKYLQECQQQSRTLPSQVWVLDSLPGTGA